MIDYIETLVESVEQPAEGYALIRFVAAPPLAATPGQFVMVRGAWGRHPVLGRAFSLVEDGSAGAILARVVGEGTRLLAGLRPGDPLSVLGPSGRGFEPSASDRSALLIAGGAGVAPLVFLAERLFADGRRPRFFYGARSADELPLRERVDACSELVVATEDGSAGEHGLITEPLARALEDEQRPQLFACGPEPMLQVVARLAVERGTPCQVALESPMACGMGTCKGCAILAADRSYRYVCSDGPVFAAEEIFGEGR